MSYVIDRLRTLERFDFFIQRKATGDRAQLARKLNVSIRTITNLKCELELLGAKIHFDRQCNSYVYMNRVQFDWNIVIGIDDLDEIRGGQKIIPEIFQEAEFLPSWGRCL